MAQPVGWDSASLEDQSRKPKRSPRKHSEAELRSIRKSLNKHHWTDLLLAYQELRENGYTRSYGGFKRIVSQWRAAKPKQRKKRKPKPYQRADYPGQKMQLDVKYVPGYCVADGRKYYQFTANVRILKTRHFSGQELTMMTNLPHEYTAIEKSRGYTFCAGKSKRNSTQ